MQRNINIKESEPEWIPGLLDLPTAIILQILGYLPVSDLCLRVSLTCKSLHKLTRSSSLWRHLTLTCKGGRWDSPQHKAYKVYYSKLLSHTCLVSQYRGGEGGDRLSEGSLGESGKGVVVVGCVASDADSGEDSTGQVVVEKDIVQKRVTSLTENCCVGMTPEWCHSIVGHSFVYPRLKRLLLKVYYLPDTLFLYQHTGLRSLTIDSAVCSNCTKSVTGLFNHLDLCPNLATLQLQIEKWEEPSHSLKVMWVAMKDYFYTRPALTRLHLDIPVNDKLFEIILDCCADLKDLQLSNMHVTCRAFKKALRLPNFSVTTLRLRGCMLTDPQVVAAIAQGFRHLKQLELSLNVQDADMSQWKGAVSALLLSRIFPELTMLRVDVDDQRFTDVQKSIQLENMKNSDDEPMPKVTYPDVVPMGPEEGQLEELVYAYDGCQGMDLDLELLCQQPRLRRLVVTRLHIPGGCNDSQDVKPCAFVSDFLLERLTQACQKLKHVDLRSFRLPLSGLACLRSLPHLASLRYSLYMDCVRVKPLEPLSQPMSSHDIPLLRSLELDWYRKWSTPFELQTPCSYFPGITSLTLNIYELNQVSLSLMETVTTTLTRLEKFTLEQDPYLDPTLYSLTYDFESYQALVYLLIHGRRLQSVTWLAPTPEHCRDILVNQLLDHPTLSHFHFRYRLECLSQVQFLSDLETYLKNALSQLNNERTCSWLVTARCLSTKLRMREEGIRVPTVCLSVLHRWMEPAVPHRVIVYRD